MFTGIIEEIGTVQDIAESGGARRLTIGAPKSMNELRRGDSVAVDGTCLSVVAVDRTSFQTEAVEETLKKTTLGDFTNGRRVNLELPLKLGSRLGGHIVLGHVDTVGVVGRVEHRESSRMLYLTHPHEFSKYVIEVGSVAINGVSLTVAERTTDGMGISLIPHTWNNTTFQYLREGSRVNIEFDMLGKYAVGLLQERSFRSSGEKEFLTEKHLKELGY